MIIMNAPGEPGNGGEPEIHCDLCDQRIRGEEALGKNTGRESLAYWNGSLGHAHRSCYMEKGWDITNMEWPLRDWLEALVLSIRNEQ